MTDGEDDMDGQDPMDDPDRCTATASSTGERCKNPAIPGSNVCRFHGGSAPQVQEKAQERLNRMADEFTAELHEAAKDLVEDWDDLDTNDKIDVLRELRQLSVKVWDRTGHGPTEKREVDATHEHSGNVSVSINHEHIEHDDG